MHAVACELGTGAVTVAALGPDEAVVAAAAARRPNTNIDGARAAAVRSHVLPRGRSMEVQMCTQMCTAVCNYNFIYGCKGFDG